MLNEITINNAFGKEEQPNQSYVVTLDGYQGCQLLCPYCFQMDNSEWSQTLYVKTNIIEKLAQQLEIQHDVKELFIGSQSDPYMPIEKEYKLTRGMLELLSDKDFDIFIVTKSDNRLILRDLDVMRRFKRPVTVIMGLSNIHQAHKGSINTNIEVANTLFHSGIKVDVHITPVLPYIMDIDAMIDAVDQRMSIYLDKLRVLSDGNQDIKIYEWVKKVHPQYEKQYYDILFRNDERYMDEIYNKHKEDARIKFMFEIWSGPSPNK